ncbi:type I restriction endonuclease subunit S [Salinivibrio sp. ML198]|uniref:restriction endonuclease subunit S n=1 Tax=Salinivibrio sp. ML198 TaxID=1909458 RepID=UPI000988A476|nr:restriction endonuclease subunit S [Salinivibrio sp. ML198]OOE78358.1 type I restriction endonuclease subunit S [Salinivibrio sp. ML198]
MSKYQAYPKYEPINAEWLSEIPIGWSTTPLKHVASINMGQSPSSDDCNIDGIGVPFLQGNAEFGVKSPTEKQFCPIPKKVAKAGDLLFSVRAPVGSLNFANKDFGIGRGLCSIRGTNAISQSFLWWVLPSYKYQFDAIATGSTFEAVSAEEVGNLNLALPPILEQTQIANFLDHETAKIDTLIEKQQQLIKLLKEKRQAVISHAVTKGLNPHAPMKDSGVEWLGEVPEHWGVLRLKHLIESLESGVSVNAADIPARTDEVGVLKTSCVYTCTFRAEENKTVVPEDLHRVKCPVRKGAIIISRMNTPELVGASALVTEDVSNVYLPDRLWQTNFNQKVDLDSEYLAHFMTVEGFRVQISLAAEGASSSMQNIAKEDYLSINCLLPPLSEQQQIVQHIRQRLEYFSKLDSNANDAVSLLKERRTALISAAVTGKIDVRNWQAPTSQEQALEQTA